MKTEQILMNERSTPEYFWTLDEPQQQPQVAGDKDNGVYNFEQRNKRECIQ